ncbi:MAG: sulfotransferase family 2 domain-containing protein [Acidimicrobiales bacterium]
MIRVSDANRDATRDLFEKGALYCVRTYDHANTKPIIFVERDIALMFSGRAGSSFAMKWYLHHNKIKSQYAWAHAHRTKVIYPAAWHQERREAMYAGGDFKLIRFTRNPFTRAVSSFLHSTQNEPVSRNIVKWLGHRDGYSFLQFLSFVADTGVQRVNNHFAHQFSYLEKIHELDAFCPIEGGRIALNELESQLGLPESSDEVLSRLRRAGHELTYRSGDSKVAERVFEVGTKADSYPSTGQFYDERTESMVLEIYSTDFDRFGYDRSLPELSPQSG